MNRPKKTRMRVILDRVRGGGPRPTLTELTDAMQHLGEEVEVSYFGGLEVVANPSIPEDEAQFRDPSGKVLGKITGIGRKEAK